MNEPCGVRVCEDIWVQLQDPGPVLTVFHVLVHKALIPLDDQEADALAQI